MSDADAAGPGIEGGSEGVAKLPVEKRPPEFKR